MTQHGDVTGNFCSDINGCGQGARSNADGEHSISPVFGFMADAGEQEMCEEDTPIVRLGAQRLARNRIGFGKYRGGLGYEQIATRPRLQHLGLHDRLRGLLFSSTQGLFGGYSSPAYQLCKIKGINIFEVLANEPKRIKGVRHRLPENERPIPGGKYSTHDMGMTFEMCQEGEVYMICQGTGGGYGDVLERDPALVMKDVAEDLMTHDVAKDIYKVVYDERTLIVDEEATVALRNAYRLERIRRGKPYDQFCQEWVTAEPPTSLPYYGSWEDPKTDLWHQRPRSGLRWTPTRSRAPSCKSEGPEDCRA